MESKWNDCSFGFLDVRSVQMIFIHVSSNALRYGRGLTFLCHSTEQEPFPFAKSMNARNQPPHKIHNCLFERDETRRVGGTDTGSTVLDRLAVEIVSNLFREKIPPLDWRDGTATHRSARVVVVVVVVTY